MNVPMLDLPAQFRRIGSEIMAEVTKVFETQYFILGPRVKQIESEMAALARMNHGIGTSCGTDALILALMALDIRGGDEVITTPYTFFATASAIARVGAKPVFADIDGQTFNLDVKLVESAITSRTRALLPVHLFGLVCEPGAWQSLAELRGLYLVEDACQAVGATRDGFTAGGIGDLSCFSFYPTKNLGGAGDGGMVLARHDHHAERMRSDRVHGGRDRYYHDRIGICARLDELQAAVLLVKLRYLSQWNTRRRQLAALYNEGLRGAPVRTPVEPAGACHTYHQYVIRAPRRDELREFLKSRGIGSDIYYPVPLHLQKCFEYLGGKRGQFPVAEQLAAESVALPMSAELTEDAVAYVSDTVREFYGGGGA